MPPGEQGLRSCDRFIKRSGSLLFPWMMMIVLKRSARFALEALFHFRVVGEALRQNLDRDASIETRVGRAIDLAHSSGADGRDDLIGTETRSG